MPKRIKVNIKTCIILNYILLAVKIQRPECIDRILWVQIVIFSCLISSSMPSEIPDQTVVAPFSNRNWTYWNPLSLLKFVAILPVQLFSRKFLLKVLLENLQRILNFLLAAISPLSIFQNSSWFYNLVFCTNVLL